MFLRVSACVAAAALATASTLPPPSEIDTSWAAAAGTPSLLETLVLAIGCRLPAKLKGAMNGLCLGTVLLATLPGMGPGLPHCQMLAWHPLLLRMCLSRGEMKQFHFL